MVMISTQKEYVLTQLGENLFKKVVYICQMVKRLLKMHLKREMAHDRDN